MKSIVLTLCALAVVGGFGWAAPEPVTLKLWPDGPPSRMIPRSEATAKLLQSYGGTNATRLSDVTEPTITIYRPEKPNGTSVIVAPGGSFMFLSYLEYQKRNLSAELHICAKGGHGFGMRKEKHPINDWPQRCAEWMTSLGFLEGKPNPR